MSDRRGSIADVYTAAVAHLKSEDPILKPWIEAVGECRIGLSKDKGTLFKALVSSIGSQQLSVKAAATILGRFCVLTTGSERYPTASEVLFQNEDSLREIGLSRPKARYILELAATLDQYPTLEELDKLENESIMYALLPIKGIGRWSVEMLLMFTLGRLDVLPVDDLGIQNGFKKVYKLGVKPKAQEMIDLSRSWAPYRSVGSWYLWQSLAILLPEN